MIVGVGSDLASINRIEETISIFGDRFLKRSFAPVEYEEIKKRQAISAKEYACSLAKRFAAKEAFAKALGTGFREGVFMKDIAVVHQKSGKPQLKIYGGALKHLKKLAGSKEVNVQVSMSDDYPWAQAFVIIELI